MGHGIQANSGDLLGPKPLGCHQEILIRNGTAAQWGSWVYSNMVIYYYLLTRNRLSVDLSIPAGLVLSYCNSFQHKQECNMCSNFQLCFLVRFWWIKWCKWNARPLFSTLPLDHPVQTPSIWASAADFNSFVPSAIFFWNCFPSLFFLKEFFEGLSGNTYKKSESLIYLYRDGYHGSGFLISASNVLTFRWLF